jgi:hypothetical protein
MNAYATDKSSNTTVHATVMTACGPGSGAFDTADNLVGSVPADCRQLTGVWNSPTGIRTVYPYTLFNKSPLQLRRIGALGGKAHGRNQRARRALMSAPPASVLFATLPSKALPRPSPNWTPGFPGCAAEKRSCPNRSPSQRRSTCS